MPQITLPAPNSVVQIRGLHFYPSHKQHNSNSAEKVVEKDAVVGKSKWEASTLQLQNGRLPTLKEIFEQNSNSWHEQKMCQSMNSGWRRKGSILCFSKRRRDNRDIFKKRYHEQKTIFFSRHFYSKQTQKSECLNHNFLSNCKCNNFFFHAHRLSKRHVHISHERNLWKDRIHLK